MNVPLTTIEIEQIGPEQWHANLETGSLTARRATYTAPTLGEVMRLVEAGYYDLAGVARPVVEHHDTHQPAISEPFTDARPVRLNRGSDRLPPLRDKGARHGD